MLKILDILTNLNISFNAVQWIHFMTLHDVIWYFYFCLDSFSIVIKRFPIRFKTMKAFHFTCYVALYYIYIYLKLYILLYYGSIIQLLIVGIFYVNHTPTHFDNIYFYISFLVFPILVCHWLGTLLLILNYGNYHSTHFYFSLM